MNILWLFYVICCSNEMGPAENPAFTPEGVEKSLNFLINALNWDEMPNFVTINSFVMPTEINTELQFEWDNTIPIPKEEFQAQIHYDLATYYFFKENYDIAIPYFINATKHMNEVQQSIGFLTVKSSTLEGFLIASNSKNGHRYSLTKQLKSSIVTHFVVSN